MSYSLHIERGSSIPLHEWVSAASKITSLRAQSGHSGAPGRDVAPGFEPSGELEVIDDHGRWKPAFHFSDGRGSFPVRGCDKALRTAASLLASELGASIVGDDGERYSW
ncbi:MAG: hypothetical protein ACJ8GK_01375 [Luteimonas sp.]